MPGKRTLEFENEEKAENVREEDKNASKINEKIDEINNEEGTLNLIPGKTKIGEIEGNYHNSYETFEVYYGNILTPIINDEFLHLPYNDYIEMLTNFLESDDGYAYKAPTGNDIKLATKEMIDFEKRYLGEKNKQEKVVNTDVVEQTNNEQVIIETNAKNDEDKKQEEIIVEEPQLVEEKTEIEKTKNDDVISTIEEEVIEHKAKHIEISKTDDQQTKKDQSVENKEVTINIDLDTLHQKEVEKEEEEKKKRWEKHQNKVSQMHETKQEDKKTKKVKKKKKNKKYIVIIIILFLLLTISFAVNVAQYLELIPKIDIFGVLLPQNNESVYKIPKLAMFYM